MASWSIPRKVSARLLLAVRGNIMGYKEDFASDAGWCAADVSVRLNTTAGQTFAKFLKGNGVDTVIRYYASSARPKTLTLAEAQFLSEEGFGILPVFQDSSRDIKNFSSAIGKKNAASAIDFAKSVGQPADQGSTILFAVDADYSVAQIDGPILDHFAAVKTAIGGKFRIGAYGSGALLSKLLAEKLIEIPWISMSRAFLGTEQFFYSQKWAIRQIPPDRTEPASKVGYDRNVIRIAHAQLGAFQVATDGGGMVVADEVNDATLGNRELSPPVVLFPVGDLVVATDGLRLRRSPNAQPIRELTIGEHLVDLGDSGDVGWRKVRSGADEGVCFAKYLRPPERPAVEAVIQAALAEWLRFDRGRGNEDADPYCGYVREMWAAIGEPYDGRSKYPNGKDVPWSAAFISWIVRRGGPAYANFQFASSHSVFVNNAIKAQVTRRLDKPYWGYPITAAKPALGDIIQRNRSGNTFSFSYAENHANYESHSDLVVEVTPDVVRVIGGNVSETVSFGTSNQEYHLTPDGFLKPGQGVIALLKNRAGLSADSSPA